MNEGEQIVELRGHWESLLEIGEIVAEFVDAIEMRAMEINEFFGLDALMWPDRCWGKITHAGRKSLREHGEVSHGI